MASQNPVLTQHDLQVALDEPLMPETPTFESRPQTALCFPWPLPPLAATATDTRVGGGEVKQLNLINCKSSVVSYICTLCIYGKLPKIRPPFGTLHVL